MLRFIAGIIIGVLCGAIIGATSFAVAEKFLGRGIGILTSSPALAAIIGIIFMGVPSLVVGIVISSFKTNLLYSSIIGFITALAMLLLFALRSGSKYFYESGYFDKQLFWYDVIVNVMWLIGLPLVAMIISVWIRSPFLQSK